MEFEKQIIEETAQDDVRSNNELNTQDIYFDGQDGTLNSGAGKFQISGQSEELIKNLMKNNPQRIETLLRRVLKTNKYRRDETIGRYDRNRFDTLISKINRKSKESLCTEKLIKRFGKKKYGLAVKIRPAKVT